MQDSYLSLFPPLLAITIAIWRKNALLALLAGIIVSCIMTNSGNLYPALNDCFSMLATVFSSLGNIYIIGFSLLIGALVSLMNKSGAVDGFIQHLASLNLVKSKRSAAMLPTIVGSMIFTDTNLSIFTAGTVSQKVFDQYQLSREKLAYLIDSTCAPISILILINGWGAYVLGLIQGHKIEEPLSVLIATIQYNFYPILALMLAYYTAFSGKSYGALGKSKSKESGYSDQAINQKSVSPLLMWVPLFSLIIITLSLLFVSGEGNIRKGSGSFSVFFAIFITLIILISLIRSQRILTTKTIIQTSFLGIKKIWLPVSILILSLVFGDAIKALGTGIYLSQLINLEVASYLIAPLLFIVAGSMAFATGTSWGTFAILIPIAIPVAINTELPIEFLVAAVLGGGIFGDHASPISDTTVVASIASGCDHVEHVKTQLVCAVVTILLYTVLGALL